MINKQHTWTVIPNVYAGDQKTVSRYNLILSNIRHLLTTTRPTHEDSLELMGIYSLINPDNKENLEETDFIRNRNLEYLKVPDVNHVIEFINTVKANSPALIEVPVQYRDQVQQYADSLQTEA